LPQPILDRLQLGRFRSYFLPALLVVALGVTGFVTHRAYKASLAYRTAVESVLAAYVSNVAEDLRQSTQMSMWDCELVWLYPMMLGKNAADMSLIRPEGTCNAGDGGRFDIDLMHGTARTDGVPAPIVSWLLDTIPAHPTVEHLKHWRIGMLTRPINGKSELISYAVRVEDGREVRAIGFIASGALPVIMDSARSFVKTPIALGARRKLNDYFNVSYATPGGPQPAVSSATHFAQKRDVDAGFGGITVIAGFNDAGFARIAPDGLPRDRGWEFLGLFMLAVGLVVSSLLLLRQEEQLARTRANFVSSISHELRTPLAQIRMFAEMLLLGRVRSERDRRRSLEIIDTEARRLGQLVENVLQVARSEHGQLHVNPINMRIAPVIRECVESFSVLGEARSMEFRMELEERLVAPVDSAALRQIVLNLLDNASKYGPDGQRVVVGMALFESSARIWVDDEGNGIPVRERERVFNPFYRASNAEQTPGSGIGLAVVRELVALHGGDAWIEDAPDAGTRVVVQFPMAQIAEADAEDFAVA
jgi:signal transduction histidine kinase